jgi:hypothetical protein
MLLQRHFERSASELDALAARADRLSAEDLADALIQHVAGTKSDMGRACMIAILEGRGDEAEVRRKWRARHRKQVAAILRRANRSLSQDRAHDRAAVVLYILKGERALAQEEPTAARRLVPEVRRLVAQYIADTLRERA